MPAASGIPSEISAFLRSARRVGRLLLLKGRQGTGMSFFAVQLAEALGVECIPDANYVSIHISMAAFYEYLSPHRQASASALEWKAAKPLRDVPGDAYRVLLNWVHGDDDSDSPPSATTVIPSASKPIPTLTEFGPIVTSRVEIPAEPPEDEPDLPEFDGMREYVRRCADLPAFLVIDTIDELAEHYGVPARRLLHALRIDLVDRGLANVVCLQEDPEDDSLDNLADGIIVSNFTDVRERREWSMTIRDLRGQSIEQPVYRYTLRGARIEAERSQKEIESELKRALSDQSPSVQESG